MHCPASPPRLDREDPINGYHHDFNAHHKPDGHSGTRKDGLGFRVCNKPDGHSVDVGALMIRIGFWGPLYFDYHKEPPK